MHKELHVQFSVTNNQVTMPDDFVPESRRERFSAPIVIDQRLERFDEAPDGPAAMREAVRKAMAVAQKHAVGGRVILMRRLQVWEIPAFRIQYNVKGDARNLWLYGTERRVYAPQESGISRIVDWVRGRG